MGSEVIAQSAMVLSLIREGDGGHVVVKCLPGDDDDLNATVRDLADTLVIVANAGEPPFDDDPRIASLTAELAAAKEEVERLKKLEAAVRDEAVIIQLVKACSSQYHDDRHCDYCSHREDGMDQYQQHLLSLIEPKESDHA